MSNLRRSAYLLNGLLAVTLVFALAWKPAPPPKFVGVQPADVPMNLGGLVAHADDVFSDDVKQVLAGSTTVSRTYQSTNGMPISFLMIGGTDRSNLHDPRSCLVGGGWRIEDDHPQPIPGTNVTARSCRIVRDGGEALDVLYFYVVDGTIINEVTRIRAEMLVSAALGLPNRPVYFLRFIQPSTKGSNGEAIQRFAAAAWNEVKPRIQGGSVVTQR
jgi:hypothetical protein